MTVGIAAICESEADNPKVVISADRLVTAGIVTRIEWENTNSKMVPITDSEDVIAWGIASGSVSFGDEVFHKLGGELRADPPRTVRDIVEEAVEAYQGLVRETIERQVLSPNGLTFNEFKSMQSNMNAQIVQSIYQDMLQKQDEISGNLNIMIAGVDTDGGHIFGVRNNDMAGFDSLGYHAIGMGQDPANSTFIRNRYDDSCSLNDALLDVVEAKVHAEEAQGVGRQMDIAVLEQPDGEDHSGAHELSDDDIISLREIHEKIFEAQEEAREEILSDSDYSFDV